MPTKSEFKFNCPTCSQRILAATEWTGRRINCPSCRSSLTIPEPPREAKPARKRHVLPSPLARPKSSSRPIRVELPGKVSAPTPQQKAGNSGLPNVQPTDARTVAVTTTAPASRPAPSEPLRVAVLTPAVKLEIVLAVRRRIASESAWLSGRVNGKNAYAAKVTSGEPILVDVKSSEATRFSLMGAFLVELRQRQVVRTATGRTRFLDHEIPDAVRDVLTEGLSDEAREQSEAALESSDWMRATHAQCLAALDVLEELYSQRMNQARAEKAKRRLGTTRLPDLIKKLEKKARIESEEVATALYHELMEVRRRLDRLEHRAAKEK